MLLMTGLVAGVILFSVEATGTERPSYSSPASNAPKGGSGQFGGGGSGSHGSGGSGQYGNGSSGSYSPGGGQGQFGSGGSGQYPPPGGQGQYGPGYTGGSGSYTPNGGDGHFEPGQGASHDRGRRACHNRVERRIREKHPKARSIGFHRDDFRTRKESGNRLRFKGSGSYIGGKGRKREFHYNCLYNWQSGKVVKVSLDIR